MEHAFKLIAGYAALLIEFAATTIVVVGAVHAGFRVACLMIAGSNAARARREIWLGFAGWLVLGLEFALAADIVRTSVSPTWDDVGQLSAIAVIRTFLNYFLTRDLESFAASDQEDIAARSG